MAKPTQAAEYTRERLDVVQRTCLYIATILGNLMEDRIVIAGGFAPYLLVPQDRLPEGASAHIGTDDLDLGLSLALLEEEQYHEVAERLRAAGFKPDTNDRGNTTGQRWVIAVGGVTARIDFLIPPGRTEDRGGRVINLEGDFAAFVTPGLDLAWQDRVKVSLVGDTIRGERASREVWVCGPATFVLLKALAFRDRGERKDAYDLYYVLRNYGSGPSEIGQQFRGIANHPIAPDALKILGEDFTLPKATGPMRVAAFLGAEEDEALRADVVAFVSEFLAAARREPASEGERA